MTSQFSYWEKNQFFTAIDLVVIGSGIVGLNAALHYKSLHPTHKVLILERGILPNGASTKNAGFACFGSPSELLDDLRNESEDVVFSLVEKRWKGLQHLRQRIGDENMDYQHHGGMELFTKSNPSLYAACSDQINYLNQQLKDIIGKEVYQNTANNFGFEEISGIIKNQYEGQIDTGKMMTSLLHLARDQGIHLLNNVDVLNIEDSATGVLIETESVGTVKASQVVVSTNGFAKKLLDVNVQPARAQVLITKPLKDLPFKGTFHYDKGYYYFRNIHNRILFGGGRNLDIEGETTTDLSTTPLVINELERLLNEVILPHKTTEIDFTWAGVMGVGETKQAIVKPVSKNVYAAVRMGGMGVAIGTLIGIEVAELVN